MSDGHVRICLKKNATNKTVLQISSIEASIPEFMSFVASVKISLKCTVRIARTEMPEPPFRNCNFGLWTTSHEPSVINQPGGLWEFHWITTITAEKLIAQRWVTTLWMQWVFVGLVVVLSAKQMWTQMLSQRLYRSLATMIWSTVFSFAHFHCEDDALMFKVRFGFTNKVVGGFERVFEHVSVCVCLTCRSARFA